MNYKSLLSLFILAVAYVKADRDSSQRACVQKKGMFLENPNDKTDTRYVCFLPRTNADVRKGLYCGTYDGWSGCYAREYSNVNYCDIYSSEYHSRGCALGVGYLYDMIYFERKQHQEKRDACVSQQGLFFEASDPNDYRYACFLPYTEADARKGLYCGTYDGKSGCYAREYSNINYCDIYSSEYHGRGCALGVGYLYNDTRDAYNKKFNESKKICNQKKGKFLENADDSMDDRFACLLPYTNADGNKGLYCGTWYGFNGCYHAEYGNIDYCDINSKLYNGKGCFLGLGYLYDSIRN